jgi:hypothetical protein
VEENNHLFLANDLLGMEMSLQTKTFQACLKHYKDQKNLKNMAPVPPGALGDPGAVLPLQRGSDEDGIGQTPEVPQPETPNPGFKKDLRDRLLDQFQQPSATGEGSEESHDDTNPDSDEPPTPDTPLQ